MKLSRYISLPKKIGKEAEKRVFEKCTAQEINVFTQVIKTPLFPYNKSFADIRSWIISSAINYFRYTKLKGIERVGLLTISSLLPFRVLPYNFFYVDLGLERGPSNF